MLQGSDRVNPWTTSDPQWLEGSGITPSALIAIAGPYDLPLDDPEVEPVFPTVPNADDVRPVALVTSKHPPVLLIHGEEDKRVLPFHTRRYSAALMAAGVPVDVHWLKDAGMSLLCWTSRRHWISRIRIESV